MKILCAVCHEQANIDGSQPFHNPLLLGSDDVLCFDCFLNWYDNGLTKPAEIRAATEHQRRVRALAAERRKEGLDT